MATSIKDFQISNIIYNSNMHKLTFEFDIDGSKAQRVNLGVRTIDDITQSISKILQKYYTIESES